MSAPLSPTGRLGPPRQPPLQSVPGTPAEELERMHAKGEVRTPIGKLDVIVSIGNSDDKLSQERWSEFWGAVMDTIYLASNKQVHGVWMSASASPFQNAAWAFELEPFQRAGLRRQLATIAAQYEQESVAWLEGTTQFILAEWSGLT